MINQAQTAHGLSTLIREEWNPIVNTYAKYLINFSYGKGAYLYDSSEKKYLDMLSGIAVTSFGHNNEAIKEAVVEQLNKFWHTSNLFESGLQNKLALELAIKSGLDSVFFSNSGTEANEAAIKFARKFGNEKTYIITALNGFHGRTYGSLSATPKYKYWEGFFPLTPGFIHVPFNDIEALKSAYNKYVCAVMLETVQGEGGIYEADYEYLQDVREFCDENNILLILDEVQCGVGRTGKFFAYEHYLIKPDIITLAKGIANGLPLGATIVDKRIANVIVPGCHGSTFGGNPVSVSAALKVLDLLDNKMLSHISSIGTLIMNELKSINSHLLIEIRGKGLMIGVEFDDKIKVKDFVLKLLNKGIIAGTCGENTLRLLPPFIISYSDVELFLKTFKETLKEF